jgi:glycosyltransferase involved in cell wall biosynthesis
VPSDALFVLPNVQVAGGQRLVVDLVRGLNRAGSRSGVFAFRPAEGEPDALSLDGVDAVYGTTSRRRVRYLLPAVFARLVRAARGYDVVIGGLEAESTLLALAAARALRKPAVAQVHVDLGGFFAQYKGAAWTRTARRLYKSFDAIVAVSEGAAERARSFGVPAEALSVIPNGVDLERVRRNGSARAKNGRVVLGVGRLTHEKGFDLLVEAHARVRRDGLDHRLVLVGDGPERPALEADARRLGVEESVRFAGFVVEPGRFYASASLFCLPSRSEGFGLALLEALAFGLPVVAADCPGGPREVLDGGAYGELVAPGSADPLAEAIGAYFRDPAPLEAKAAKARGRAEEFSIDRAATAYAELFDRLARS